MVHTGPLTEIDMVHAHAGPRTATHDLFHPEHRAWNQPDLVRVAGITGCVLLNAVVLMALMRPADLPMPTIPKPPMVVFDLSKPKPPPPAPPPEPVHIGKTKPDVVPMTRDKPVIAKTSTTAVQATEQTDVAEEPVFELPFEAVTGETTDIATGDAVSAGPIEGVSLQYASAPAPAYTRDLIAQGVQGTVQLKVLVDVDGKPLQVDIHHSSGNRRLDEVARRHVLKTWRFAPAMRNGTAVQAIGIVPIDFRLD